MGICYRVVYGKRLPRVIGIPKVLESILNRMWAQEASGRPSSAKLVEIFNDLLSNYTRKECAYKVYQYDQEIAPSNSDPELSGDQNSESDSRNNDVIRKEP